VVSSSLADVIVSESFDYTPTNLTSNLSGKNGGTGFSGAWGNSGNPKINAGLSMAGVFSSGGSATFKPGENGTSSRPFETSVTSILDSSGVYYGSYLFSLSAPHISNALLSGVGTSSSATDGDNAASYIWAAKGYNTTGLTPGQRIEGTPNPYASLNTAAGGILSSTTYLYLFQVDMTTHTTTSWILTQAQLANFSGSLNAATLNAAAVGSGSTNVFAQGSYTGALTPGSQTYLDLFDAGGNGTNLFGSTFDEIRFSNANLTEAVTAAVPEPNSIGLAFLGLLGTWGALRKRRFIF